MSRVFDLVRLEEEIRIVDRAIFELQLCTNEETSYLIPVLRSDREKLVGWARELIELKGGLE